jgi:hypothetical protein
MANTEEQRMSDDYEACDTDHLNIDTDSAALIQRAEEATNYANRILRQIAGNNEVFLIYLVAIDSMESSIRQLKWSEYFDSQHLRQIKSNFIDNLRGLDILICGGDMIAIEATSVDQEINLAMQALFAEQKRTGNAFPEINQLVYDSCDVLSSAAKLNSEAAIQAYNNSLHNVVNYVNSVPAPTPQPLNLNLLAMGAALGIGGVFTLMLLAYLFYLCRANVSRMGIFSNNTYQPVSYSDDELELESPQTELYSAAASESSPTSLRP